MGKAIRLLIVEDVEDHALLIVRELEKGGFAPQFERVETKEELERALEAGGWDAVISDYNLPGFNGADALQMVQAKGDIPFLLVSGAIGEELAAELIKGGAHGYIRKGNYARLAPTLERELSDASVRRERRQTAEELAKYREHLEDLVHERTELLERANEALRHNEVRLKEANEALRLHDDRLRVALKAAAMCTWRYLPDSLERIWDSHCYTFFHLPEDQPLTHERYLSIIHPDDREMLAANLHEALAGRRPYNFEYRIVLPDGSLRWVMTRGEFTGEPKVMTGVLLDITNKKMVEAELVEAKKAAEEAAVAKSSFLANMSHEIRTPLNGVLGITDLVLETELNQLQQQYLQMIRNSAEVLLSVVNDVLDFSKIEAGMMQLEEVEFDLRDALEKVVEMLALHAHRKGLELSLDIDSELPPFFFGDPLRLRQILTNLTVNAVKFTDEGEIVVRLRGAPAEGNRWRITFSVTDTGIGIPQGKLSLLFNSFTQVDPSMARSQGGTGLGLAITKRLVEQMGGRIWVESTEGTGSSFIFEIELKRSGRERERELVATEMEGLRTLVLDDNETNRQLLVHWLSQRGALVETAAAGREAVRMMTEAAAAGTPFELALLDMNLPDIDGFQVAEELRAHFPISELGIMMLTSEDIGEGARRARDMGMVAYIIKPVRPAALMEAVYKVRSFRSGETTVVRDQPQPEPVRQLPFCTRVLLAEDNTVNLTVAEAMLRRSGAKVTPVMNGAEALEAIEEGIFDVVLMDVQMPGVDGLQASRRIRECGCDVPIIGLTALAMPGDRERCLEAGMDDYLSKPFSADDLIMKVALWMQRRPRAAADTEVILRQVGGSSEILECVVATFRENAALQLADVRKAVEEMDHDALEKAAHRLKGAVMVVGAETARCLAEQLELAGKEQELQKARPLQEQLAAEIGRVLESLGVPPCCGAKERD
ncbi:response regulator [Geomonas sp. RF6]|uniref:hybrid sensor histidine kinase/response regulator n=1 Tax=Geomonas sp. RF6 TaxID=2897342 RepID=UPI001E51AF8F|nr:response regulator [Geomonas sp. RF6]UFS69761.1 response regulator [Geomonas sp. RF6]